MANRVFFTFHCKDVIDFRANVVRNHWLTKPDREAAGFYDASIWEKAKKQALGTFAERAYDPLVGLREANASRVPANNVPIGTENRTS